MAKIQVSRNFSTRLEKYKSVKRSFFPYVKYLGYGIANKEFQGLNLTSYEYPTQGANPKALLFFIHDLGDYSLNYGFLFKKFAGMGVRCYAFDR